MSDPPNAPPNASPGSSDPLPEEAPGEQVSDDALQAGAGAARKAAREQARRAGWDEREREEEDAAAAEAARIGGGAVDRGVGPAERPIVEAGGGEAEGFEEAESALIEHASHGDQQSAHAILHHRGAPEEPVPRRENGEADHEHSSELPEDQHG